MVVEMVRTDAANPPAVKVTVDGEKERLGLCLATGVIDTLSETVPANPFRLATVICLVVEDPFPTPTSVKSAVTVKVGVGDAVYMAV